MSKLYQSPEKPRFKKWYNPYIPTQEIEAKKDFFAKKESGFMAESVLNSECIPGIQHTTNERCTIFISVCLPECLPSPQHHIRSVSELQRLFKLLTPDIVQTLSTRKQLGTAAFESDINLSNASI